MHVANGGADLIIGGDLVVSASDKVLLAADPQRTRAVVNNYKMMSGDFTRISDLKFPGSELQSVIEKSVNVNRLTFVNSNHYAEHLFGDTIAANFFMIGIALQKGYLPISLEAIERAIELNARSVEMNKQALHRGRQYAVDQASIDREVRSKFTADDDSNTTANHTLQDRVELRAKVLVRYQNNAYAERYRKLVQQSLQAEESKAPGMQGFADAVARYYYKLLTYKDEYEVARLYSEADFRKKLEQQFEGDYQIRFHMAPPIIGKKDNVTGLPVKTTFGPWMERMLPLLAKFKLLRGTPFDPFGRSDDRKLERKLIHQYEQIVNEIMSGLTADNHRLAIELASYPEFIRGYGHIKRQHVEEIQPKVDDLLIAWRQPETTPQAA